ncbi:DUF3858 domain-containing protein [Mucilaginibacter sp. X4EP1]|uniref:DUF3858 domain-containing protein n=1 Tax=Mucilaginibacter sp. X4EP1 TaxID=2723092 RepID=UPI00216A7930|nr:DUF3858 domain-containing protein [Mucilaginibacter sp. X4EP1]MCS3813510.1 hypothetical protein [Mucilaginibacter sp. X4EP1]
MKKTLLFLFILSGISKILLAQNFEYGKASQQEIDMKQYDKDTSANAVVLNEFGSAQINVSYDNAIRLTYEYHVKIKIFNHRGFGHGTVYIPVRNNEDNNLSDDVNNISGITTYKDDNGATQVEELDTKKIYKTRDYKYQSTLKFAMPALHDGCVIEYRYIIITPFFEHFHSWQFQSNIPKVNSEYNALIPGFWQFNIALRGPLKLTKTETGVESNCFSAGGSKAGCVKLVYGMKDIPAFIAEEYMTSPKNYLSALNFDLIEYTNPYTGVKTKVTEEWKDIDAGLKNSQRFGDQLRKKDFVKDHIPPSILNITDTTEKAKAIYKWVQGYFKWNNYEGIYCDAGIKKAFETHNGGISEINLTLVTALNAVGIKTEAVLLSTREHGFITKLFPSIGDFNYVIAHFTAGGKSYLLDATDVELPFGILPLKCLNDQGRAFSMNEPSYWITLEAKQSRTITCSIDLTLQDDGKLKGTINRFSMSYEAFLRRKTIKKYNTIDDYVDFVAEHLHKIKIIKSNIANADSLDVPVEETYNIEVDASGNLDKDKLVLNPYILDKVNVNPFKLNERNYPVDMGMPSDVRFIINIHVPPQYTVENNIHDQNIQLANNGGRFLTTFTNDNNNIIFSSEVALNKSIFKPEEYAALKDFFNRMIIAEKTELVFHKKS